MFICAKGRIMSWLLISFSLVGTYRSNKDIKTAVAESVMYLGISGQSREEMKEQL